jgi:histidinol-phosphate/aromatic aminotransferase/cobyric acid decarboxylase-like protein
MAEPASARLTVRLAVDEDREVIYRQRHAVYACELGQHAPNAEGRLTDALDAHNLYVVALLGGELVGFVSITPPGPGRYSVDKYFARSALPFPFDAGLYEVRLLTVAPRCRGSQLGGEVAGLLIYAAFRWVEAQGGTRVVAIGRREVVGLYKRVGLRPLGLETRAGAVTYDLLAATLDELRGRLAHYAVALRQVEPRVDWQMGLPFHASSGCAHGGAFFEAVGDEFDRLGRRRAVINADVLDAWFPPAPAVLRALGEDPEWLLRTSPPPHAEGLTRVLARARGVGPESVLCGAGSSALIFLALRHWLRPSSRVLLPDPTYGEYAHVLEKIIGCRPERLSLSRAEGYVLCPDRLRAALREGYDWVILVNPNSPTGRHVPRDALAEALREAPAGTRVWVDETYVEYAGPGQSLERAAARGRNVVVCKSMSKVYALSGARVGYLCGPAEWLEELRPLMPPYAVSLPAQVAAVAALGAADYYAARWAETHALREELADGLRATGRLEVVPGVANFLLCHLADDGPDAATVLARCRARDLFLRNAAGMGSRLGGRAIRVAVKDAESNRKVLEIVRGALGGEGAKGNGRGAGPHSSGRPRTRTGEQDLPS